MCVSMYVVLAEEAVLVLGVDSVPDSVEPPPEEQDQGQLEEDGREREPEREVVGAGEDAAFEGVELAGQSFNEAVESGQDQTRPPELGLEGAELAPGEGLSHGGQGGDAQDQRQAVRHDAGKLQIKIQISVCCVRTTGFPPYSKVFDKTANSIFN